VEETANSSYLTALPTPEAIRDRYTSAIKRWKGRNKFIANIREHLVGANTIMVPTDTDFVARPVHTFLLQSILNEKAARFTLQPRIQVIPSTGSPGAREASTELENGINATMYWGERMGDGDVWSKVVEDAIMFDIGVERIECAPAAHWPELTRPIMIEFDDGNVESREELYARWLRENKGDGGEFPLESEDGQYKKYRDAYKKEQGPPIRSLYVNPENFFPIWEGSVLAECFEREDRAVRDVLRQKRYSATAKAQIEGYTSKLSETEKVEKRVTIIHYSNHMVHAYYALLPVKPASDVDANQTWPSATFNENDALSPMGVPVLLHWYPHNLGRCIYNVVAGRYGGWKSESNTIERVMNALTHLSQVSDEIASQVATSIATLGWPTTIAKLDDNLRDPDSTGAPRSPRVGPGKQIALWKSEDLDVLKTHDPAPGAQWFYSTLVSQMEKLSGSSAVYGQQDPGVRTGYHAFLQISQSEHLDEKLDAHLAAGAISRGLIYLQHIRAMQEKVWVFHRWDDSRGHKTGKYIAIDPKALTPLPELDAAVRRPKAIDWDASMRTAQLASQDTQGPGTPTMSMDTIRETILGMDAPDVEEQKIQVQNEKRKLMETGVMSKLIGQRIGLIMAERANPNMSAVAAAAADPALLASIQNTGAEAMGGISPETALGLVEGGVAAGVDPFADEGAASGAVPGGSPPPAGNPAQGMSGVGGGPAPYRPQPEQAAGREIMRRMQG
jgi:hypothetical protein